MAKIKRPYCRIDGVVYQLEYKDKVLRFPNTTNRYITNLNIFIMEYINDKRSLDDVFEYYTTSGLSYELVWNAFSTNGINNHLVTQGKGKTKSFRLYK